MYPWYGSCGAAMVRCVNACPGSQEPMESRVALCIKTFPYINISLTRLINTSFLVKAVIPIQFLLWT